MIGPKQWFVAFYDAPVTGPARWWQIFTRHHRGFGHCSAFGYDPATRIWLYVDWTASGLAVYSFDDQTVETLLCAFAARGVILESDVGDARVNLPSLPLYCVSVVKHLIGYKGFAVTPWQLYRALKRRGAREMFTALRATIAEANHEKSEGAG
jgi:hypothetical protein